MPTISNKIKAIGQGLKAAAASLINDTAEYTAAGIAIKCPHCGESRFKGSRVLMNTTGMSFVGLDWLNSEATVLKCAKCSRIQWFADELEIKE